MDQSAFKSICSFVSGKVPCGIAIMGKNGVILASSDPTRVGNQHALAALIVDGKSDSEDVTAEQALESGVMLEGCNVPLDFNGQRIASLGISAPLEAAHGYAIIVQAFIKLDLEYRQQQEALIKQLEAKNELLHESSMVLQQVLDNIPARVFWKDEKLSYMGCNQLFANDAGVEHPADIIGLKDSDMVWADQAQEMVQSEKRIISSGISQLHREEIKNTALDEDVWLRVSKIAMKDHAGSTVGLMGTYEDITESKKAISALEAANARFRIAFNSSPMMIVVSDIQTGEYIDVNKRYEEVMHCKRENLMGKTSLEYAGWLNRADRQNFVNTILKKGEIDAYPSVVRTTKGQLLDVSVTGRIVNIEGIDRLLVYIEDVTERNQINKALGDAKGYISDIINSMPSILIGVGSDGTITQWNLQAESFTGLKESQAVGCRVDQLLPQFPIEPTRIKQAIRQHELKRENTISLNSEGKTLYYELTIYPLVSEGTEGAVIRIDDISERIQIEEMIVQSEKMLSIGGLAAGMAHEVNNPLAGILQNMQVIGNRLTASLQKNEDVAKGCGFNMTQLNRYMEQRGITAMIESASEAGKRAAQIVENMLSFSRKESKEFEQVDFSVLIDKTLDLAANDYSLKKRFDFRRVQIVKEYPDFIPPVSCHVSKIQQVILNLLKNGAQAMLQNKRDDNECCFTIRLKPNARTMILEIEDNGPGIDDVVRKRIFEPFFTTKSKGAGTGLGLSVSYFIIAKDHNGFMDVKSNPGEGACFVIGIPLSQSID